MGTSHQKKRAFEPVGPYEPTRPRDAERQERQPMAAGLDEERGKSHLPTTQSLDAFDEAVARKNADPNMERVGRGETASREENARAEEPEGYSEASERGWKEMSD